MDSEKGVELDMADEVRMKTSLQPALVNRQILSAAAQPGKQLFLCIHC